MHWVDVRAGVAMMPLRTLPRDRAATLAAALSRDVAEPCTSWVSHALGFAPGSPEWRAIAIESKDRPWSAAEYFGVEGFRSEHFAGGTEDAPDADPSAVWLVQWWAGLTESGTVGSTSTGHTWLWFPHPQTRGYGFRLHSSVLRGARGNYTPLSDLATYAVGAPDWIPFREAHVKNHIRGSLFARVRVVGD